MNLDYLQYKYVVIKDKRLGLTYYILVVIILLYIVFELILNKAYLQFDHSPSGHVRIITNSPPLKEKESHLKIPNSHCCKSNASISGCRECRNLDGLALNWPVESKAISIATYIIERWEETGHKEDRDDFLKLREDRYFTLNPEHVLLKIEHSISSLSPTASEDAFAASRKMMTGRLVARNGTIIKKLSGTGKPDGIRLIELLKAATVDTLDAVSDASNARNRTFRENGIVLRVTITYENSQSTIFGTSDPVYTYSVRRLKFSEYKVKQEIPVVDPSMFSNINGTQVKKRKVLKRFCTRVEFAQSGKIGVFSLRNLLNEFGKYLCFLVYAATVVEILAIYVLPDRETYKKCIYEYSDDIEAKMKRDDSKKAN